MAISTRTSFLIVDDYDSVRRMIKGNLKTLGFKGPFLEAENGEEGLKVLTSHEKTESAVQFIICDWRMPVMNGLEFLKEVRSRNRYKSLPFLVLTTEGERDTVVDTIMAGATNYLLKPWNQDSLAEKIAYCWDKCHSESEQSEKE